MTVQRLILASGSPRRRELLQQVGLSFEVVVADVDESVLPGEAPADYVLRLAQLKARCGFQPQSITLGADTTVCIDDEIIGKPCGQKDGIALLQRLSGRRHEVMTAVAAYDGVALESCVVVSAVYFRPISLSEAQDYWATGEGADKAGGYGIQGIGGIFVERLEGSYSAVVGLPLEQTEQLLRKLKFDTWSMRLGVRK